MKYFKFIILLIFIQCTNKTDNINNVDKRNPGFLNLDSLLRANKDNIFFLTFWNGMNEDVYDSLVIVENSKNNLDGTIYNFYFENKENLEVSILEDSDLLKLELEISPTFDNSHLVCLELKKPYEDPNLIVNKLKIIMKDERHRTREEKDFLEYEKEESEREQKIRNYCINEIISLYDKKYGKSTINEGDYNQTFDKKSTLLSWDLNNKKILIDYLMFENSKYLNSIKYLDKEYFKKVRTLDQNRLDSIINNSKNHI